MIHSYAWLAWLAAAFLVASGARNPFYLILILLNLAVISAALRPRQGADARPGLPLFPLAAAIFCTATLLNALTSHVGATPLFTIPGGIPLISGPVTLEALAYGAINGLVLSSILAAFAVFNQAVPVYALIRMIPQAFHPAALTLSIAVTFLPTLTRRVAEVREAQIIRGREPRRLADWGPLLVTLLVDSLENAIQLAETMTARGFASASPRAGGWLESASMALALALLLAGSGLDALGAPAWCAPLAYSLGAACAIGWMLRAGRRAPRTRYRREPWTLASAWVLAGAALTWLAFTLPLPALQPALRDFSPYPRLALPGLNLWTAIAVSGLLGPLIGLLAAPSEAHD